jgi:malonyl-CoA/methylmalonyl-CoA synthetase
MLWLPKFDACEVIGLLPHASVMMGVPTFSTRLLAEETFGSAQCQTMRLFISGSAPLLAETFDSFRMRTGHTILERYGMTKGDEHESDRRRATFRRRGPLPGVSVRVATRWRPVPRSVG